MLGGSRKKCSTTELELAKKERVAKDSVSCALAFALYKAFAE